VYIQYILATPPKVVHDTFGVAYPRLKTTGTVLLFDRLLSFAPAGNCLFHCS